MTTAVERFADLTTAHLADACLRAARSTNPELTFREHLRAVGGEVEV